MGEGTPERIAVIGSPGAGKSTLALAVAKATGLPLVHLDREYWQPGSIETEAVEWQARNAGLIAGERWIIDGHYGGSLGARLARAQLVVWLDLPTWPCLAGVVGRAVRHRGRARPDMREGCPERLDRAFLEFLAYIVAFRRTKRPGIKRSLTASGVAVVRLSSTAERARFGRRLAAEGLGAALQP